MLHVGGHTYGLWHEFCVRARELENNVRDDPDASRILGKTRNLSFAELVTDQRTNPGAQTAKDPFIQLREGDREYGFGSGLDILELSWILKELNEVIGRAKSQPCPTSGDV